MERHHTKAFDYISLFSGIGGFEFALNDLGGRCVMSSEIDKLANKSYACLFGEETVGDIKKIHESDVPNHTILVGGFPCQAFSSAGHRRGFEDSRGTLFFEIARISKEKQPTFMILENVKGLVTHNKGETLKTLCEILDDIGYALDFTILNSKYFDVPQSRERLYFICVRKDLIEKEKWHTQDTRYAFGRTKNAVGEGKVTTFNFDWPLQETIRVPFEAILDHSRQDYAHYIKEHMIQEYVENMLEHEWHYGVNCIHTREDKCSHTLIRSTHTLYTYPTAVKKYYAVMVSELYPFEEITQDMLDFAQLPIKLEDILAENDRRTIAGELDGQITSYEPQAKAAIIYGKGLLFIRRTSPKENLRLQGFPEGTFEKLNAGGMSTSAIYKQIGNAVTVNVVKELATRLLERFPNFGETQ